MAFLDALNQGGTPPLIPGVTQMSPERWQSVQQAMGAGGMPMGPERGGMPSSQEETDEMPRLVAAQFALVKEAATLGPEALDRLAAIMTATVKEFKKEAMAKQAMAQPTMPPMYGGGPPPMMGEQPNQPFLSPLAMGGQP